VLYILNTNINLSYLTNQERTLVSFFVSYSQGGFLSRPFAFSFLVCKIPLFVFLLPPPLQFPCLNHVYCTPIIFAPKVWKIPPAAAFWAFSKFIARGSIPICEVSFCQPAASNNNKVFVNRYCSGLQALISVVGKAGDSAMG